jgi:type 1 glutamine amidotransferase
MQARQGEAVRDFVQNGGSALILHNTTHVSLTNRNFRDVLGAAYTGHPPIRPYRAKLINRDHPITEGVNDFTVTDEQHYMDFDKDRGNIFMETENLDGLDYRGQGATAVGGFAHEYGQGRVCYLAPGHLLTVLWNPELVKLHKNALDWLLRKR